LLESLRKHFGGGAGNPIAAEVVLKADLMKRLRNLYVHKGLAGIPRRIDHPEIESWIAQFEKRWLPYSTQQARDVVAKVIGKAVDKGAAVGAANRPLGPEFFYALFTLTNIRRFVLALDAAFPTDPRSASAATAS
jgi:hypothetical protein